MKESGTIPKQHTLYKIRQVNRVHIKFNTHEEYENFRDWKNGEDIFPVVRGGMFGNKKFIGYFDDEDAAEIKAYLKRTKAKHFELMW